MKKCLLVLIILISISATYSNDYSGSKTIVAYVQPNSGDAFYAYGTFGIDIGYKYNAQLEESETARTKYTFDLTNIPSNATISNVYLTCTLYNYDINNPAYKYSITQIDNYSGPEQIWSNIGNSPILFSDLQYGYNSGNQTSNTLTTLADNNKGSYLYIGSFSQNEINSNSYANLDISLHIDVELPSSIVDITAQNNFIYGKIKVGVNNPVNEVDSPYPFTAEVNDNVNLEAKDQSYGGYDRVWNDFAPNVRSDWYKDDVPLEYFYRAYSFEASENDDGVKYKAGLRKNLAISRYDQFEFDQTQQHNNLWYIVEQNSGNISAPTTQTLNGKSYNYSYWTDNMSAPNPRNIQPNDNKAYTAFYKYKQHSNDLEGYSSGSQRKFVRTNEGKLHYVYKSMGHIWYERSTDNGITWNLMNSGKPLENPECDTPGNPAIIDIYTENDAVAICFFCSYILVVQRYHEGVKVCEGTYNQLLFPGTNPTIAFRTHGNDKLLVCWQDYGALSYALCELGITGGYDITFQSIGSIDSTDINSSNPSCVGTLAPNNNPSFHLVWQQGSEEIKYCKLNISSDNTIDAFNFDSFSYGSPVPYNTNPSISVAGCLPPNNSGVPIVSWIGRIHDNPNKKLPKGESSNQISEMITRRGLDGAFYIAGNQVSSINNNSTVSTSENTVIVWNEGYPAVTKWAKRAGAIYRAAGILSYSGVETQVSNGSSLENIKAMVYNTESLPYSFNFANDDFSTDIKDPGIEKIISDSVCLTYGRSGIVSKDGVNFVFNIGDIILADTNIHFISRPDTLIYNNTNELNQVTRSLTFHLDNQSHLYFTNYYYTVNSDLADSALTNDDVVTFKAELVNANTNTVSGTFDEITYTKNNLEEYDNINYQVDCSNIEEGDYYLRLVTAVAGEATYYLANIQNDNPELEKRFYENVNIKAQKLPDSYDLSQNYPNPFNPSTIINYQIPQTGFVTLKVYDILGEEVATLVNEQKNQGRYSVNFDASKLASGVYIYRLKVNDYVSSKKMLLIK